jgi:hypothetical protein
MGLRKQDGAAIAREVTNPYFEIVFVNRTLGGTFGNLTRLRATADWRAVAERCLRTSRRS